MAEEQRPPDATPDEPPPGRLLHPSVRSEHSDARFGWIFGLLLAAMFLAFVVHTAVWRFFLNYRSSEAAIKASRYPLAPTAVAPLPANPRLEQINRLAENERGNVYLREVSKDIALQNYGDAGNGYVHIPIDRAMDYLADKLPVRAQQPSAEQARRQNGLVDAGESNSGRMFRGSHE